MLKDYFSHKIKEALGFEPSEQQQVLINLLGEFVSDESTERSAFLLRGYAGTGKTTVLAAFVKAMKELKIKTFLLAPTGRAAKVLTSYAGKEAYTIHKKIYRQQSSSDGFGRFLLDVNLYSKTIFIVDEASMISNSGEKGIFGSGQLLADLISYVFNDKGCKLIFAGDTAQLPPVGLDVSPALDRKELEANGLSVVEVELTQVVRQAQDSGILWNATRIREMLGAYEGKSERPPFPQISHKRFPDIKPISGSELIDGISDAFNKYGEQDVIVVCRSNKRANRYNQGIRNSVLFREEELSVGDLLMIVKNNYFWTKDFPELEFIANGDTVEVKRINKYAERYGYRFADVTLAFTDYENLEIDAKIILDTLSMESASLTSEQNKEFYHKVEADYAHVSNRKQRLKEIRDDKFFNALQIKYAYAVTCHKAQGGQWKKVFIDQGYLTDDMINTEFLRWLYTAITRSSKMVSLVNFKKEFYPPDEQPMQ